ncbi:hypothetical protein FACS1894218_4730 [Bacilli bacterium]|nr:hypothetical protein FACS1894218_4730 [Bacilli bacterium]
MSYKSHDTFINYYILSKMRKYFASVISCFVLGGAILSASSCGERDRIKIILKWENNQNTINANLPNPITYIKCEATVYVNNVIDDDSDIVSWKHVNLPSYLHETQEEHFIAFYYDSTIESSNWSFDLTAYADKGSATTRFTIKKYTPIAYENNLTLTESEATLDYEGGPKEINVKATVSGTSLNPTTTKIKMTSLTLPQYIDNPDITKISDFESEITFKLKNGISATDGNIYNFKISVEDDSAAPRNFILKTID